MSATLEVKLSDEQLDLLADRIAVKMGESRYSKQAPINVKDAAAALGISQDCVRTRIKSGVIRQVEGFGVTRIAQSEIARLLNSHPDQ